MRMVCLEMCLRRCECFSLETGGKCGTAVCLASRRPGGWCTRTLGRCIAGRAVYA